MYTRRSVRFKNQRFSHDSNDTMADLAEAGFTKDDVLNALRVLPLVRGSNGQC